MTVEITSTPTATEVMEAYGGESGLDLSAKEIQPTNMTYYEIADGAHVNPNATEPTVIDDSNINSDFNLGVLDSGECKKLNHRIHHNGRVAIHRSLTRIGHEFCGRHS